MRRSEGGLQRQGGRDGIGREGERKGGSEGRYYKLREEWAEGGREGGRVFQREGGREGGIEGGYYKGREAGGGRKGGREKEVITKGGMEGITRVV